MLLNENVATLTFYHSLQLAYS